MVLDAGHARLLALLLRRRRADLHGRGRRLALRRAGDRQSARSRCATAPAGARVIVGAGRTGRSLMRELRETAGERVLGFVDDNPRPAPAQRCTASRCSATTRRAGPRCSSARRPTSSSSRSRTRRARPARPASSPPASRPSVTCRFVRREIDLDPRVVLGATRRVRPPVTHGLRRAPARRPLARTHARRPPLRGDPGRSASRSPCSPSTSSRRGCGKTPWVFTDELEWTQISRSIESTGHAARRGEPIFFKSLYAYLIAPFWWIHST